MLSNISRMPQNFSVRFIRFWHGQANVIDPLRLSMAPRRREMARSTNQRIKKIINWKTRNAHKFYSLQNGSEIMVKIYITMLQKTLPEQSLCFCQSNPVANCEGKKYLHILSHNHYTANNISEKM